MASTPLLPSHEAELAVWTRNLANAVSARYVEYGISEEQAETYTQINAVWQEWFGRAVTPETRTSGAVAMKQQAKRNVKRAARDLAAILRASPAMSESMLADVGISTRAKRERIGPPTTAPFIDMTLSGPTSLALRVRATGPQKRARPAGVKGVVMLKHAGPFPPQNPDEWQLACLTNKTRFQIDFGSDIEPGRVVWITGFWVNSRLERGPTALPKQIRIAGSILNQTPELKRAA